MDKTKLLVVLAAVAVALYFLFGQTRTAYAANSPVLAGGIIPGGTGMVGSTSSALTGLENALGSIFKPSSTPASQQGSGTPSSSGTLATNIPVSSLAPSQFYGVGITNEISAIGTPTFGGQDVVVQNQGPSLPGQDLNAPPEVSSTGSFDLSGILGGNSLDASLPIDSSYYNASGFLS